MLRLEKGLLHVGSDTDGATNAFDLGMRAIVDKKSGDFVGRRSLMRARDQGEDRRQLVGLEAVRADDALVAGAHVVTSGAPQRSEGFVTSAAWSPTLRRSIGLAMLERGFARLGDVVTTFDQGRLVNARVMRPAFFDPEGTRVHA